ncbi:MAG: hypothetical protein WC760_02940 [Bacteroidia bacterium]
MELKHKDQLIAMTFTVNALRNIEKELGHDIPSIARSTSRVIDDEEVKGVYYTIDDIVVVLKHATSLTEKECEDLISNNPGLIFQAGGACVRAYVDILKMAETGNSTAPTS